jgi:hypothetical protein
MSKTKKPDRDLKDIVASLRWHITMRTQNMWVFEDLCVEAEDALRRHTNELKALHAELTE